MKESKYKEIEKKYQLPMVEILQRKFLELGSQHKVADDLGVDQSTVYTWLLKLQLEQKTILVPKGGDQQPVTP